jgi:NTP pyrophosphatase (non-canonical NTP hydrolase)
MKMRANDYQKAALRTASTLEPKDLVLNGVLGLNGEAGEVADHIKKHLFQGHELNKEHLAKELGDICWYIAIMAEGLGYDLESIMQMNVNKLMKRYPNGFEAERSLHREEDK